MQKLEPIQPGKTYQIIQLGNGDEPLFFEQANKLYFHRLVLKHLNPVCEIIDFDLKQDRIELILKFREEPEIPAKFRAKLYQSLANLFNSYAKSINKRYNRKGSLFKRRFDRTEINLI
jgi:putative transposase